MSEAENQKQVLDWLAAKHILAFRMNTGVANFGGRRVVFGVKGMADIQAFPIGRRVLWIEMKAEKGKQSPHQRSFQKMVEEHGHLYVLARSIDDLAFLRL